MRYKEEIKVKSRLIKEYLDNTVHQDENDTISKTVVFPDGIEMDIKCCGSSEEDEGSWTEAVLFNKNGSEICCSEPDTEFFGEWTLEYNGNEYTVEVKKED